MVTGGVECKDQEHSVFLLFPGGVGVRPVVWNINGHSDGREVTLQEEERRFRDTNEETVLISVKR